MMAVMAKAPLILLINPWITDFAAYDYWTKPLGLLLLGSLLREGGCGVTLIDCLDRHDPFTTQHPEIIPPSIGVTVPVSTRGCALANRRPMPVCPGTTIGTGSIPAASASS